MDWLFRYSDPSIDWSYAIITLMVRFIGVFVVMAAMQVALQLAAHVVRRIEGVKVAEDSPVPARAASFDIPGPAEEPTGFDWATVAAVGLALDLESRTTPAPPPATTGPSSWVMAGRLAQLSRGPR